MIQVTEQQLMAFVAEFLWPLFRVAGFFMAVPIFGTRLVPQRVRLGLAIVTTLAIAPLLPPMPQVDLISFQSVIIISHQVLIGLALGFCVQLLFQLFIVSGQVIAMQMGLGFASMVDPANGVNVAVLSQFFVMLSTILFLAMNGHLVMIEVFVESFRIMPVALTGMADSNLMSLVMAGSWMFAAAVLIALPVITALLIVNFSFGVMTRSAPQLNIFTIGFPFTIIMGVFLVWVSLSGFLPRFERTVEEGLDILRMVIGF